MSAARLISRSSHESAGTCPRRFYYNFELDGTGYDSSTPAMPLLIGLGVHKGLEVFFKAQVPALIPHAMPIENAAQAAKEEFEEQSKEYKLRFAEDARWMSELEEGALLCFALVYGWLSTRAKDFLEEFEILQVEKELRTPLSSDVTLMSRLDLLVRSRRDALNWVINWKCQHPEQLVDMADGSTKQSQDIALGDSVMAWAPGIGFQPSLVKGVQRIPNAQRMVVKTQKGRVLKVSDNHPFLIGGTTGSPLWLRADQLAVGDPLVVASSSPTAPNTISTDEARLLGYIVGDGGVTGGSVKFSCKDAGTVRKVKQLCKKLGFELVSDSKKRSGSHDWRINGAQPFVRQHGLAGKRSRDKFVPDAVMLGQGDVAQAFLGAYFDCDGHVSSPKRVQGTVSMSTCSPELARGLQTLFTRALIPLSKWRQENKKYKKKPYEFYHLFTQDIQGCASAAEYLIPVVWKADKLKRLKEVRKRIAGRPALIGVVDQVKSVEKLDIGDVIAVTVDGPHTLLLDGVVTHNTASSNDPAKMHDKYRRESQMWAEALAAEQDISEPVQGTILEVLYKGVRRSGSFSNPLLYAYSKDGKLKSDYTKGWAKIRADQLEMGMVAWIDSLDREILAKHFFRPEPILKINSVVEDRLELWVHREGEALHILTNGSERDKLKHFQPREGEWCNWCPFQGPCFGESTMEEMIESGRLVVRKDHHSEVPA